MGLRFRKRIRLLPGVTLNVGKAGLSTTLGKPGASVNIGRNGIRSNAGLPGTGLSYSSKLAEGAGQPGSRRGSSGWAWIAFGALLSALIKSLSGRR